MIASGELMADDSGEWLTYDDAAVKLGIKADSVRRRAAARKWPRRQGNDGKARVLVPSGAIPDVTPDIQDAITPDNPAPSVVEMQARLLIAEARLEDARNALSEMRLERDRWRDQAEALAKRPTLLDRLLARFSK